ncbi:MAG: hypothetical protein K6T77_01700 [candidate division WOR-3 bacterium]|jgi:outer membrane murein-binding lipoprotein Lpp|nr:hypothetical protein [candidate division WOR-3 bacterium]MCR4423739.1 hypothetical protein [candidate division WOR-3 bacterium]MDH7519078.1 hypothetical protein [bacterium]
MKRLAALFLIAAILVVVGCQESAQVKAQREQMATQIKTLEEKVVTLETKVEQLTADFAKHMEDFHKKAPAKTTPTPKYQGSQPSGSSGKPPKVGR